MVLSGNNTYTAGTLVNGGEVVVRHLNALGTNAGNTQVNAGFSLLLESIPALGENLNLNGTGFGGRGALVNLAGNSILNGTMTLAANATVGVLGVSDNLTQVGRVSGAFTLTKILPGTLTLGGGVADVIDNSHTATTVQQGPLILDKADGTAATVALTVGDNASTRWEGC